MFLADSSDIKRLKKNKRNRVQLVMLATEMISDHGVEREDSLTPETVSITSTDSQDQEVEIQKLEMAADIRADHIPEIKINIPTTTSKKHPTLQSK